MHGIRKKFGDKFARDHAVMRPLGTATKGQGRAIVRNRRDHHHSGRGYISRSYSELCADVQTRIEAPRRQKMSIGFHLAWLPSHPGNTYLTGAWPWPRRQQTMWRQQQGADLQKKCLKQFEAGNSTHGKMHVSSRCHSDTATKPHTNPSRKRRSIISDGGHKRQRRNKADRIRTAGTRHSTISVSGQSAQK